MGLFSDYAPKIHELGFNVLPVDRKTKGPRIKGFQRYCRERMTDAEFDRYSSQFSDWNIGLTLGPANGLIALDYDYNAKNHAYFDDVVKGLLPNTPLEKVGAKGFTRFYKYNGEINKSVNRGPDRFYDLLSDGKQTVIPPSVHPLGMVYKWVGPFSITDFDLEDIKQDLIVLEPQIIKSLDILAGLKDDEDFRGMREKRAGRHDILLGYCIRICQTVTDYDALLKLMIAKDIELFSDNEKGPWFADKKAWPGKSVAQAAKFEVDNFIKWWQKKQKDVGNDWQVGKLAVSDKDNYGDFVKFFDEKLPDRRLDLISGEFKILDDSNIWQPALEPMVIKKLRSLAVSYGYPRSYVEDHLTRYAYDRKPQLLVDIEPYDGVDYISQVLSHVKVNNVSQDCLIELFKDWSARLIDKIYRPKIQNKLIILKGGQGVGKDTFIDNFVGGLKCYFSSVDIGQKETENFNTISNLICANISEFDRTSKATVSQLKDLITRSEATYRAPYGRSAVTKLLHTSFISSCNVDDILRDYTGNRRFVIFNIESIDWSYAKGLEGKLLSQFKYLSDSKFKASEAALKEMAIYIESQTPTDPDELILEELNYYLAAFDKKVLGKILFADATLIISNVARRHGRTMRQINLLMNRLGLIKRIGGQSYIILKEQANHADTMLNLNEFSIDQGIDNTT